MNAAQFANSLTVPVLAATMTATNGTVTVALSDGRTFTAKESGKFIQNLDRKLRAAGLVRDGWATTAGAMTTTVRDFDNWGER